MENRTSIRNQGAPRAPRIASDAPCPGSDTFPIGNAIPHTKNAGLCLPIQFADNVAENHGENSPALQCWEKENLREQSPAGTEGLLLPSLAVLCPSCVPNPARNCWAIVKDALSGNRISGDLWHKTDAASIGHGKMEGKDDDIHMGNAIPHMRSSDLYIENAGNDVSNSDLYIGNNVNDVGNGKLYVENAVNHVRNGNLYIGNNDPESESGGQKAMQGIQNKGQALFYRKTAPQHPRPSHSAFRSQHLEFTPTNTPCPPR